MGQRSEGEPTSAYAGVLPLVSAYVTDLVRDPEVAEDLVRRAVERRRFVRGRGGDVRVHLTATRLVLDTWRRQPRTAAHGLVDARWLVEGLPIHQRELVLLHYWAALSVDDLARALDRPVVTVQQQLDDARRLLALALEKSA